MSGRGKTGTSKRVQDRVGPPKTAEDGLKVYRAPSRGTVSPQRLAARHGLAGGALPKGCKYIQSRCDSLRRQLEDEVLRVRGTVSLSDASCIAVAVQHERHRALAGRWLRLNESKLSASERLNFSRECTNATTARDRAIAALHLDPPASAHSTGPIGGTIEPTPLDNPQALAQVIATAVAAVLSGQLDPKRAAALNGLIATGVKVQDFAAGAEAQTALTDAIADVKAKGKGGRR